MKTIIVWYDNNSLIIDSDVAKHLNLKNGYIIKSEQEFWKILGNNCNAMISIIQAQLFIQKKK